MSATDDSLEKLELRMKELIAEAAYLTAELERLEKDIQRSPTVPLLFQAEPPGVGPASQARTGATPTEGEVAKGDGASPQPPDGA